MMRTSFCSALAVLLLCGSSVGQEPAPFGGPDYYADANVPVDGNCPDGFAGAHGHGLHGHGSTGYGVFGSRTAPYHAGLAYASGYPNGVRF